MTAYWTFGCNPDTTFKVTQQRFTSFGLNYESSVVKLLIAAHTETAGIAVETVVRTDLTSQKLIVGKITLGAN